MQLLSHPVLRVGAHRSPAPRLRAAALVLISALIFGIAGCTTERSSRAGRADSSSSQAAGTVDSLAGSAGRVSASGGDAAGARSGVDTTADGAAGAVEVVRAYYAAIDAHRYDEAYHYWASGGSASGQTPEEFARGLADTRSVKVQAGDPGRIEGAAGSRYIEIPVTIEAIASDGAHRRFSGSYVLRRAVVPGATAEQRSWRLYTARIDRSR